MTRNELVHEGDYTASRRVQNAGKYFFLQLAKDVIDELNSKKFGSRIFARRSLILYGFITGENGIWDLDQLTLELQKFMQSNLPYFNGQDPSTWDIEGEVKNIDPTKMQRKYGAYLLLLNFKN